jgi:hypothetical protein
MITIIMVTGSTSASARMTAKRLSFFIVRVILEIYL